MVIQTMRNIFKSFMTLVLASSAFMIGFYLGQEKVVSKIPDFQEEAEEKS
jgi:hypothetical protein